MVMGIEEISFVDFVAAEIKAFSEENLGNYFGKIHENFEGFYW